MGEGYDLIVVGGGIVGLASAYKIACAHEGIKILVLEKEPRLATHQTGHNSGVIHSGVYYKPGSGKASTCVRGRKELIAFALEHGIPHDICGKIIVATDESELASLERIFSNGQANGVEGIRKITPDEIRQIEPNCVGLQAVWVPGAGIIDFVQVAEKLAEILRTRFGAEIVCDERLIRAGQDESGVEVVTNMGTRRGGYLIACAGLECDRVARRSGADPKIEVVGFRGDYCELSERGAGKVRNLIYPVPDLRFPFLGVHFTRMIHGGVECGPNAVFCFKREGYGKADFSLSDTFEALRFVGTWKLFMRYWKYGLAEYHRAFSQRQFLEDLRKLIPSLEMEDLKPGRAGVRAVALRQDGTIVDDFNIVLAGRMVHVLNAPSPAATASLAIGSTVEQMAAQGLGL